jgi:bifunctional NMN adenylyltransferase/nudix hydrolase
MRTEIIHDTLVGTVVGRFMLAHEAHVKLVKTAYDALQAALAEGRAKKVRLVIVLGSAYHARTPKNPFTWVERKNMLLAGLPPEVRDIVSFVAVRDYHDDERWSRAVHRKVTELAGPGAHIQVFGHHKDATSAYLDDCFRQWEVVSVQSFGDLDATTLRAMLFAGEDDDITLSAMEGLVPDGIRKYLKVWMQMPCYQSLKEEFAVLQTERKKYGTGPFNAGDCVIRTKRHVLLIRRKNHPGRDLLAIPGGFLEKKLRETMRQCAEREGGEETKLGVLKSVLHDAFRSKEVFDQPGRSVRGDIISHAFFYDLDCETLPDIEAADDAGEAMWVLIEDLAKMEDQFYDDHFLILNYFLHILGEDD